MMGMIFTTPEVNTFKYFQDLIWYQLIIGTPCVDNHWKILIPTLKNWNKILVFLKNTAYYISVYKNTIFVTILYNEKTHR